MHLRKNLPLGLREAAACCATRGMFFFCLTHVQRYLQYLEPGHSMLLKSQDVLHIILLCGVDLEWDLVQVAEHLRRV